MRPTGAEGYYPRSGPVGGLPDSEPEGLGRAGEVRPALEQVMIATLGEMGVAAHCETGNTGVWTGQGKVAAIGVKIAGASPSTASPST